MALFNYECDEVKHIIEEVSPNYPQLTTYEKEWLYFNKYGYNPGFPVELEYETINVNPTGMVSNAIPFQYKSAILKGNTLDSLVDFKDSFSVNNNAIDFDFLFKNKIDLTYTLVINITQAASRLGASDYIQVRGVREDNTVVNIKRLTQEFAVGTYSIDFTFNEVFSRFRLAVSFNCVANAKLKGELYSVKMPVLTTVGKNLLDVNEIRYSDHTTVNIYIRNKINPNVDYIIAFDNNGVSWDKCSLYFKANNGNKKYFPVYDNMGSDGQSGARFNLTEEQVHELNNGGVLQLYNANILDMESLPFNIQIEESSIATSYESHKSNILTVNEDVTLRSNGSVHDELDLLTGKLTQRIDENGEVLSQEIVKTVALTPLNKPYEGTNHYELTSNIPCEAILEVPVVSTGKQTLQEINN